MSNIVVDEMIFYGTPATFYAIARQYWGLKYYASDSDKSLIFRRHNKPLAAEDPRVLIGLRVRDLENGEIWIDAILAGAYRTRVKVEVSDKADWSILRPVWLELRAYIDAHMAGGETITFEVGLSVQDVAAALLDVHQEFLRRQDNTALSTPFVDCAVLAARKSLASIPGTPDPLGLLKPAEKNFDELIFSGDRKHARNGIMPVWKLRVDADGRGTRLTMQIMDNRPADYHILYRMFVSLVETWAAEVQQELWRGRRSCGMR